MNALKLQRFFERHRARGEPLVLVSVTDTSGSTYSKAGDQMLIDRNGVGCGMLSGGCLESDLAVRAQVVFESGETQTVTYELAAGDDDVWGLGIGCDGSMQISLQLITADSGYAPLQIPAPTSVLVLGAGLDAVPLARLCNELGWQCTLVDHRPAYLENADFPAGCVTICLSPEDLAAKLALADFDAAIVMSHHLASDREYLRQLAASPMTYIGLLGPAARRERLLADLGAEVAGLDDRLYGPAGMELGGRGPEAIALSITAQVQSILSRG
jgi:xanthine/CO dehydrogenase XdhC/CoxF family maturation factor